MNTIRKLPISIQDFEYLRTKNYLYVDKTEFIYKLLQHGKQYFLGRPRRFGKSLFLSTLKAFFEGKKELFEGLKIINLENEWIEYPVLYIDFNVGEFSSFEKFTERLNIIVEKLELLWGKYLNTNDISSRFESTIISAFQKTGKKVVVLVDEYDKPLLSSIENKTINDDIRKVLKSFYGVLKSNDKYLHFVFLTGVTKFSQISVFSDLNHLDDISLNNKYSDICGISETELLENFKPEIQALSDANHLTYEQSVAKLKKLYDGYNFAKKSEDIYNPFSILNTFGNLDFGYYWFKTGTPTFLTKSLRDSNFDIQKLNNDIIIAVSDINEYRANETSIVPLLYQSGYLTIKRYEPDGDYFILGFPNEEVKYGFLRELLPAFVLAPIKTGNFSIIEFMEQIKQGDIEGFMTSLKAFFAAIPYDAIKLENRDHQYFQHVFYLLFTLMGQLVDTEVKNNKGRADAVVKTSNSIYVFEFKMDENATAEDALTQINSKDYAIPYTADHRKVVKIGVEFSQTEKGVKRWLIE